MSFVVPPEVDEMLQGMQEVTANWGDQRAADIATIMVISAHNGIGLDIRRLIATTNLDPVLIATTVSRIRRTPFVPEGTIPHEWLDEESGGLALLLDAMVVMGTIGKTVEGAFG